MKHLCQRAGQLGEHWSWGNELAAEGVVHKPIRYDSIDKNIFLSNLSEIDFSCDGPEDVHALALRISESLYLSAAYSRVNQVSAQEDGGHNRWARLLSNRDDRRVWEAIGWNGKYQEREHISSVPYDQDFKSFYENSFGVADQQGDTESNEHDVYVLVLDDPISSDEVYKHVNKLKSGKASGPDGVPPDLLKVLPAQCMLMISTLLNYVFYWSTYPTCWTVAKFVPLFKKGDREDV